MLDVRNNWTNIIFDSVSVNALVDSEWKVNLDRVAQLAQENTLIVDCTQNPMSCFEEHLVEMLIPATKNFIVLSGNVNHYKKQKPYLYYFPYWFLSQQKHSPVKIQKHDSRKYKLSCLNGRSRYHRIENYVRIKSRDYFKDLLFIIHKNFVRDWEMKEAPNSNDQAVEDVWVESYVETFLSDMNSQEILVSNNHTEWHPAYAGYFNDHTVCHPAYTDSYVNYVTESSVKPDILFVSEKTWKPFMAGQFAIWLGNPGTVNFLRSIGFDVFDDIIDHSYDQIDDFHERVGMLHQCIDQLMSLNLEKLFVDTYQRRLYNQELFYSDHLKKLLTNQIKDYESKISKLQSTH